MAVFPVLRSWGWKQAPLAKCSAFHKRGSFIVLVFIDLLGEFLCNGL